MVKACVFLLILLSAVARAQPDETVRIQISDSGIKPWLNYNDGDARTTFNTAVHSQALYFGPDLSVKPGYIKSWKWDFKRSRYVMKLDRSLTYHDGRPINARDFEFALVKPFISPVLTNDAIPLVFIQGSEALKRGMKYRSGMLEGVQVVDDETVEITLKSGHSRFLYALGAILPALGPIDQFQDDLYTFRALPIGCGPYRVAWSDPKSSLVKLERIKGERGPKWVELYSENKVWENEADLATGGGKSKMNAWLAAHPGAYERVQGKLPYSIEVMEFNYQSAAGSLQKFRETVAQAIDKEARIPGFPAQSSTDQIIPTLSYGFQKPQSYFNLARAKALFSSLPEAIRKGKHQLVCHGSPEEDPGNYYRFLQNSLRAVGMTVDLLLSENPLPKKGDRRTTMVVFGRYIDINPLSSFANYLPDNPDHTQTLRPNPAYETWFKKGDQTESVEERSLAIRNLSDNIKAQKIVIPLHQIYPVYFVGKRIKSFGAEENAWNLDITRIELN